MSDIPADVRATAKSSLPSYWQGDTFQIDIVASAIMAERERCFKAVLHLKDSGRKNLVFRSDALAAIRKGEA